MVRRAGCLVLVQVTENRDNKELLVKVIRHLAGENPGGAMTIKGFYGLKLTSASVGHEAPLRFPKGYTGYFLLKKAPDAKSWQLATPTAGWATLGEKKVVTATFRHSYHKALVDADTYEKAMTAIFNHLHGKKHDAKFIRGLFDDVLKQKPAALDPRNYTGETSALFFKQHVAMECFYYFGTEADLPLLEPFVNSEDFHCQVSAARALSGVDCERSRKRLVEFVEAADRAPFAKVMAVWGLKRLGARGSAARLRKYAATAKAAGEKCGFGGNIMDPRVGTAFPDTVKGAIDALLAEWDKAEDSKR